MSRVIKSAIWQTEPKIVEIPPLPKKAAPVPELDDAAREVLMASLAEREKKVEQMLREAETACAVMKQEAQSEQEQILAKAQEDAAAVQEQARQQGYAEGLETGRRDGAEQIRAEQQQILIDANTRAEQTMTIANEEKVTYLQQAEQDVAAIALQIVEKILPQHFIDVPQVILPLARKALLKIKDQNEVVLHVAPISYDMLLMARSELQSVLEGNAVLEIKSDESLGAGDCVLESPNGNVDAKLTTQLEQVKKALQDVVTSCK